MSDQVPPPKRVVKKVVKKTVVRPPSEQAPTIRYGRPATASSARPKAKVAPRPTAAPAGRGGTKTMPARPRVQVGAKVGAAGRAVSARSTRVGSKVAGGVGSASRATGTFVSGRTRAVLGWRIPHIEPRIAAVVTGVVVGFVSIGLGLAALQMFTELRGVASGGGGWGSLTFVAVTFLAFVVGDLLLSAFGSTHARLESFLGVVLAIIAILAFFLGLVETTWALAVVPALCALTYLVSHVVLDVAENSPSLPE